MGRDAGASQEDAWAPPLSELFVFTAHTAAASWPGPVQDGLANLSHTLEWLLHLLDLREVGREECKSDTALNSSLERAKKLLKEAAEWARKLRDVHSAQSGEGEKMLHEMLQALVKQLSGFASGDTALLPLAWPDPAKAQGELQAALVVVRRTSYDEGTVALMNAFGSGSEYHPRQLNGSPTWPVLCWAPISIENVKWPRLSSSVFWLFALRPVLKQTECGEHQHPVELYEALLPWLTRHPRAAQVVAQLRSSKDEDWRPVPMADGTKVHTTLAALDMALLGRKEDRQQSLAPWAILLVKWEALKKALLRQNSIPPRRLRQVCEALASQAAELGTAGPTAPWQPRLLERLHAWIQSHLSEADAAEARAQILPVAPKSWTTSASSTAHAGFERLMDDADTEKMAGLAQPAEVVLPVPLVQIPERVQTLHEAVEAMRRCSRACLLLENQRSLMPHADFHIIALVQRLFSAALPVPLPPASPSLHGRAASCFWRSGAMPGEVQDALVREVGLLMRHFVASSLSLPQTLHLHAVRLLTLAAATAVLDAVIRQVPADSPAGLSRIYSGQLRHGVHCRAFGLAAVPLAEEMKELPLTDPCAVELRTAVLDYLTTTWGATAEDGPLPLLGFGDMRPSAGDRELLQRLTLITGFSRGAQRDPQRLAQYLAGHPPEFLGAFPALAVLRDASFLLRWLCVPIGGLPSERRRPDGRPWRAADAELRWEFQAEESRLRVFGFQRYLVLDQALSAGAEAAAVNADDGSGTLRTFFTKKMAAAIFGSTARARISVSAARSSDLAGNGQIVRSEDDTLHLIDLPTFGGRLTPCDTEQLLGYLTVPYLRTPLVLQFFSERMKFGALASPRLQAMLDAVLFEPGAFLADERGGQVPPLLTEIRPLGFLPGSPESEVILATPAGRLVHELVHSTPAILRELDGIFRLAMERDMPTFSPAAASVLYAVRLWARAAAFAKAISAHSGSTAAVPTRGFDKADQKASEMLGIRSRNWQQRLHLEAVPTLERWCSRAMEAGSMEVACAMWLHLALIYRWDEELTMHGASTLLCAELFLNANLKVDPAAASSADKESGLSRAELLGFVDTEIFELFHATRPRVYSWLRAQSSDQRDRVLEHVVSVVASLQVAQQNLAEVATLGRRWLELDETWEGAGRFSPSPPAAVLPSVADQDFERWLAASADSSLVEVNLNVGELQFRQHTVTKVPKQVLALPEFQEVFPDIDVDSAGLLWALVEKAPKRERYTFAGLRYEFWLWKQPEVSAVDGPFTRTFHPADAPEEEQWIVRAILGVKELDDTLSGPYAAHWYAPYYLQTGHIAKLRAVTHCSQDMEVLHGDAYGYVDLTAAGAFKEVEIFRNPATPEGRAVVHMYETVKCGPRLVRTQVLTSDPGWSYSSLSSSATAQRQLRPARSMISGAALSEKFKEQSNRLMLQATPRGPPMNSPRRHANSPSIAESFAAEYELPPSLEIVHADTSGESVLVPQRFLTGALPDCLLEAFEFWRGRTGRLVGRMQPDARQRASVPEALAVEFDVAHSTARVQRVLLGAHGGAVEEAKQVDKLMHSANLDFLAKESLHTLVDLLHAAPGSVEWEVARWALQLDDLSHVLVWTMLGGGQPDGHGESHNIDIVEFPRLGLTFSGEGGSNLRCDQHGGLRVVCRLASEEDEGLRHILRPFPRFVLLEDDTGELSALVSVADKPTRTKSGCVVLARAEQDWVDKIRVDHRHQLFAVHSSNEFLMAPTLVSELHLMLLQVHHGMYAEACRGVVSCVGSGLPREPEECLIWEEITAALTADESLDAAILRLKLVLQLHHQGKGAPDGWDPESDLTLWTRHGSKRPSGRLLTAEEDAALLGLCAGASNTAWELRSRRQVHSRLLRLDGSRGNCVHGTCDNVTQGRLGPGTVVVMPRAVASAARSRLRLEEASDQGLFSPTDTEVIQLFKEDEPPPEDPGAAGSCTGQLAVPWILRHVPLRLPRDFLLLYELLTGARTVWLVPSDDTKLVGELMVCLLPPEELSRNRVLAGLLRILEAAHPQVLKRLPRYDKGDVNAFAEQLVVAVREKRDELQLHSFDRGPEVVRPNSWAFKLDATGSWCSCEEPEPESADTLQADVVLSRVPSAVGEDPQNSPRHSLKSSEAAGFGQLERRGKPLANPRLLSLLDVLNDMGDRRMPSAVWDFDCRERSIGDVPMLHRREVPPEEAGSTAAERGNGGPRSLWDVCRSLACRMQSLEVVAQLPALASMPLMPLGLKVLISSGPPCRSTNMGSAALRALRAERCGLLKTPAGRSLLKRLEEDASHFAQKAAEPRFLEITAQSAAEKLADLSEVELILKEVDRLIEALRATLSEDKSDLLKAVGRTVDLANGAVWEAQWDHDGEDSLKRRRSHWAQRLGRIGGSAAALTFQDVMQLLVIEHGVEAVLPHLNPLVTPQDAGDAATCCAVAMLLSTRTIICRRCVVQLTRLKDLLLQSRELLIDRSKQPRSWLGKVSTMFFANANATHAEADQELAVAVAEAAGQAAAELATEQTCFPEAGMSSYDPRLLCFEFVSRLVLRKKQVALVRAMLEAVEGGDPLVHQMLMGEGKTTVVTPLLVLLTATADRACVVCCPAALLEFTCRVLRERLCAALARPVVVFNFTRSTEVSEDLYLRLVHSQDSRSVLCAAPTSLKSLMLRFLLTVHDIDIMRMQEKEKSEGKNQGHRFFSNATIFFWDHDAQATAKEERSQKLRYEAVVLAKTFDMFRSTVLLLDELDLLMHPLRSELHWPLGEHHILDFTASLGAGRQGIGAGAGGEFSSSTSKTPDEISMSMARSHVAGSPVGARWQVAFHLLDGLFSFQLPPGPAVSTFRGHAGAAEVLDRLRRTIATGLKQKHFQTAPHLVLLSVDFYDSKLRPILAEWMLLWLRRRHPIAVPDDEILAYLCGKNSRHQSLHQLGDQQMKALNLARKWLVMLLPHLASRIHRVHYGLLSESSASWANEPRARRHFAVPFIGKDAPSETSQFSHPDVQIGLTWLAYRFSSLRHCDFLQALSCLTRLQREEADVAPRFRHAHQLYNAWVAAAGAHVRGDVEGGLTLPTPKERWSLVLQDPTKSATSSAEMALVPSLEWIDTKDKVQVKAVARVLRSSPFLMEFFLHEDVFPQLLQHSDIKLSASGQDLGGESFCGSRLGFSGTPNDLLPRALGKCVYAEGDDARMLNTLTDPTVVQVYKVEEGWSALSLLRLVAKHTPPLSALIDVGALITGLANVEVAQTLLSNDLPYEAVVFCDQGGEQRVLRRGRPEPVKLAHCTLPPERRFVFYDQVHTTGIDIRHAPSACAALTLGKDATFRDFAQGAYRMRGIGRGQRLRVLLTPEVTARVQAEVPDEGGAAASAPTGSQPSTARVDAPVAAAAAAGSSSALQVSMLDRVNAWLLVRQAANEHNLRYLLRRQAIEHEGRRCAYQMLMGKHRVGSPEVPEDAAPTGHAPTAPEEERDGAQALDLFRERVHYIIETTVCSSSTGQPAGPTDVVQKVQPLLDEEGIRVVEELSRGLHNAAEDPAAKASQDEQTIFTEMEQEHEQELFAEQEQEKEQEEEEEEEEVEEELTEGAKNGANKWQDLRRDDTFEPWSLEMLSKPPTAKGGPFYPASQFELCLPGSQKSFTAGFPSGIWVSSNFHKPGLGRQLRRLRTPAALLEWVPNVEGMQSGGSESSASGPIPMQGLQRSFDVLGLGAKGSLGFDDAAALLSYLGVDASPEEVERVALEVEAVLQSSSNKMTVEAVAEGIRRSHALVRQPNRFYVLVTLAEAEAIRVALHQRASASVLPERLPYQVALRLLRRDPVGLKAIDATPGWEEAPLRWHGATVASCLTFLEAEVQYSGPELEMLWEALRRQPPEKTSSESLRDFFLASYAVRRRPQPPCWGNAPVARLFKSEEEHQRLQRDGVLREVYVRLLGVGLLPAATFARLDQDSDGVITPRDLSSPQALSLGLPSQLLLRLLDAVDPQGKGSVSEAEWATAFEPTQAAAGPDAAAAHDSSVVAGEPIAPPATVPLGVLQRVKIELVGQTSYSCVWSSKGSGCRKEASIWKPDQLVSGVLRVTALRFSIGHYLNRGFSDVRGGNSMGVGQRLILEVRDKRAFGGSSKEFLKAVADHYCPCPVTYRQVWCQQRGEPLFIWRPIPPRDANGRDAYVALGMVATTTPDAPDVKDVRCVAKSFCRPVEKAPVFLWDDTGAGGRAASVWLVNTTQVLWTTIGHSPPQETFWELAADAVSFGPTGKPSVHVTHEQHHAQHPTPRPPDKVQVHERQSRLMGLMGSRRQLSL